MSRLTGFKIGVLELPLKEDVNRDFIVTQVTGISDVSFSHAEVSYEEIHTIGNGRDITIILSMKSNTAPSSFYSARREVSLAAPLQEDIILGIYVDDNEEAFAQTTCKVRNVSASFSDERPTITIDLTSIYTCLVLSEKVEISRLPFGADAHIPMTTHELTPVQATIFLAPRLAKWYRIYLLNWLSINVSILLSNYGIESVPEGSTIMIDSNEDDVFQISTFGVVLHRPGFEDLNIETACDVGPGGFNFAANEPMIVRAMKIPASISGECVDIGVYPRLSGV